MKYIELLEQAKKENLNITKLFIANEVDILLRGHEKINEEMYEEVCAKVYEYYLEIDYSSINDVAKIVCDLYINNQEINEEIIREELENMYL